MSMRFLVVTLVSFWLTLVSAKLRYSGADYSSLLLLESTTNVQYSASTKPQPFEQILYHHGVNLARIRLWTGGTYDLHYALKLAKRAQAVGMAILIDLHYSDNWADPGKQAIPSGWPVGLKGLASQVYDYTYEVMQAFNSQGTPAQFIQIGNEINNGLLWPAGQISANGFSPTSRLLHAGATAVRKASPSTQIIIHLANGWDLGGVSWFFSGIFKVGETEKGHLTESDVDVFGFSIYPYYGLGGTFHNLNSSIHHVVSTYKKDIMILETDFPVACDTKLSEPTIHVGADGQIAWIKGISTVLNSVNHVYGDKAIGLVYWEPGWLGNAALGSPCSDNLLVNSKGVARESMDIFRHT